jgi:hypothetical protein
MTVGAARIMLVAFVLAGLAGATGLLLAFRTPCGGILRRYAAAYDAARACRVDADCLIDPMSPAGPGLCDRARAAAADRSELLELERAWSGAACPAPGAPCPPSAGARCDRGRCGTAPR